MIQVRTHTRNHTADTLEGISMAQNTVLSLTKGERAGKREALS